MRINALVVTALSVAMVVIIGFLFNQHRVVYAEPKTPHVIYGIIKDASGNTLGSGINVQTRISNINYAQSVNTVGGSSRITQTHAATGSGYNYGTSANFQICADDPSTGIREGGQPGQSMIFVVNGKIATPFDSVGNSISPTFTRGSIQRIDLIVSTTDAAAVTSSSDACSTFQQLLEPTATPTPAAPIIMMPIPTATPVPVSGGGGGFFITIVTAADILTGEDDATVGQNLATVAATDASGAATTLIDASINDSTKAGSVLAAVFVADINAGSSILKELALADLSKAATLFSAAASANAEVVGNAIAIASQDNAQNMGKLIASAASVDASSIGKSLAAAAAVDSAVIGAVFAVAASEDSVSLGKTLVAGANVSSADMGTVVAIAATADLDSVSLVIIEAAKEDNVVIANVIIDASKSDSSSTGKLIVGSAKQDIAVVSTLITSAVTVDASSIGPALYVSASDDIEVAMTLLEKGPAADDTALKALGSVIPTQLWVPVQPPVAGTDQTGVGSWVQMVDSASTVPYFSNSDSFLTKLNESKADAKIDVSVVNPDVPDLRTGRVIKDYLEINPQNFTSENVKSGYATLSIDESWLTTNNIHQWSLEFSRFDTNQQAWKPSLVKRIGKSGSNILFGLPLPGFSTWSISGSTEAPEIHFTVDSMTVYPAKITAGETASITVNLKNVKNQSGEYFLSLWVNDQVHETKRVVIAPNYTVAIRFDINPTNPGKYSLRVDSFKGELTVDAAPVVPTPVAMPVIVTVAATPTATPTATPVPPTATPVPTAVPPPYVPPVVVVPTVVPTATPTPVPVVIPVAIPPVVATTVPTPEVIEIKPTAVPAVVVPTVVAPPTAVPPTATPTPTPIPEVKETPSGSNMFLIAGIVLVVLLVVAGIAIYKFVLAKNN